MTMDRKEFERLVREAAAEKWKLVSAMAGGASKTLQDLFALERRWAATLGVPHHIFVVALGLCTEPVTEREIDMLWSKRREE